MRVLLAVLCVFFSFSAAATPGISLPGPAIEGRLTSSSVRWKERVQPIGGAALRIVCQLNGVYFIWKKPGSTAGTADADERGKRDIGFIAEEVGKVVPELVEWEVEGKYANGLKYDRVSALTVEAIKEQQRQMERLVSAVASLQSRVASHEARLCAHDNVIAAQQRRICGLETKVCTLETSMTDLNELVRELDFALADVEDAILQMRSCSCGPGGAASP